MSTPFKCPACDGFGKRARKPGGKRKKCRACQGSCVVWSLDTYRPAPYYWQRQYYPFWDNGVVLCGNSTTLTDSTVTAYNGDLSTAHITDAGGYTTDLSTASWTVS